MFDARGKDTRMNRGGAIGWGKKELFFTSKAFILLLLSLSQESEARQANVFEERGIDIKSED